jgi:hypothetical protein
LADELEILGRFFLLILGDRPQSGERTRSSDGTEESGTGYPAAFMTEAYEMP